MSEMRRPACELERVLETVMGQTVGPRSQAFVSCARPDCECLIISSGGTGQQVPSTGAGSLGAADLGHTACDISPLGGGCH